MFKSFFKWLKPGGTVLISDYCKSFGTPSLDFSEYIKQRGYDLHDVKSYGQVSLHLKVYICCFLSYILFIFSEVQSLYLVLNCSQMLKDAGFVDIIAEDRTEQVWVNLSYCMHICLP